MTTPPFPPGPFDLCMADYPWPHRDLKGNKPAMGGCAYPRLSIAAGRRLPVRGMMAKPAALALWVTAPHSAEGAHCMIADGWGFQLVTLALVWVKTNPRTDPEELLFLNASQGRGGHLKSGLGHWVNGNVELCYLGFNSSPRLRRVRRDVKQLIFAPVGEHSAKPPEAYRRLEALFGDVRRIEMFARRREPNWSSWGLEVDERLKNSSIPPAGN